MVVYDRCMLKHKTWRWPFTAARAQHSTHTHSITPSLHQGKGEKRSLMFYKYSVVSQNLRAAQRRGGSSACVCFRASNITRGRSHWKSCWKHCQLMSPTGTLLAHWVWLEHHVPPLYQWVTHLWLAGSRWCTAGSGYTSQSLTSQEMSNNHLRTVAKVALCLLVQRIHKDRHLPFLMFKERKRNPALQQDIFLLCFSQVIFFWPLKYSFKIWESVY